MHRIIRHSFQLFLGACCAVSALFVSVQALEGEQKIISLSPAATEILFALGAGDKIVGDTTFCNYPEGAKSVTKVGTFSDPNIEKIISLRPDIIFATGLEQTPAVERLRSLGLKVFVSDPRSFAELMQSIKDIGGLIHKEKEASVLTEDMQLRLERVKARVQSVPPEKRPKVYFEIWYDPIMTAGPGSIVDELINLAGGTNIAFDAPRAYSRFSAEVILKRNPDVIIIGYMTQENTYDSVSRRVGWQDIHAVKNKRVIAHINPDLLLRPSPRLIEGLQLICKALYGEEGKK